MQCETALYYAFKHPLLRFQSLPQSLRRADKKVEADILKAMDWIKQMRSSFGTSFLVLIFLIYWTQGFRSFAWMAVSYQLKDGLKLSPSASQLVFSVAFFPWSVKPLYGILSDCVPIRGRRRLPYLIIASILSLVPWLVLGAAKAVRNSLALLTVFLTLQNFGSALADVVVDAMVAEAAREERAAFAGDLQSLSWLAMAVGGIAGSLIGGLALSDLRIDLIFLLFSIFPTIQLFACGSVGEKSFISSETAKEMNSGGADEQENAKKPEGTWEEEEEVKDDRRKAVLSMQTNTSVLEEKDLLEDEGWVKVQKERLGEIAGQSNEQLLDTVSMKQGTHNAEDKQSFTELHKVQGMRKRKDTHVTKGGEKSPEVRSHMVHHDIYVPKGWFLSVKSAVRTLVQAMRQPAILRPMMWFFIAQVTIPNISTAMFYYQTDFLHLDASFLGTARVVGWGGLMLGTFIYNRYLKRVQLRKIFLWVHIGLAILNLLDIVLVSRFNVLLGISDKTYVLYASALADAVSQFKLMPFLILSGRLCPPGIEGTLFALFMSINNFGSTLSSFFGAILASALHISSGRFDNLALGIYAQALCTLIPVCFLFLIPKNATGISSDL